MSAASPTVGMRRLLDRIVLAPVHGPLRAPTYRFLRRLLREDDVRRWLIHQLSDQMAMREASFSRRMPGDLDRIRGFADCWWLFSSNELNHGLARLRLDEAAYLYNLVRSMDNPRVAELGTYKGGSSFLMAAAGASVVTVDNGKLPGQDVFVPELIEALDRVHLRDCVEIIRDDARTHPVAPGSFDLVFFDCMYSYETTSVIFERWWPAVRTGGALLFRDGKDSVLAEAVAFVNDTDFETVGGCADAALPGAFVLVRKRA